MPLGRRLAGKARESVAEESGNVHERVEVAASSDCGRKFGSWVESEWDAKVIVDAKEMREATARVMKRNQIPADRSEDLRTMKAAKQ